MSSPDLRPRRRFLALALILPLLAGCSFSPLYGNSATASATGEGFAYAKPETRLAQIVSQELSFRLGTSTAAGANQILVSATGAARRVGRTSPGSVLSLQEYTVTASVTVTDADPVEPTTLMSFSRFATASYEISGQVAADKAAERDASEKAARAVADSIRLVLAAARNRGEI